MHRECGGGIGDDGFGSPAEISLVVVHPGDTRVQKVHYFELLFHDEVVLVVLHAWRFQSELRLCRLTKIYVENLN